MLHAKKGARNESASLRGEKDIPSEKGACGMRDEDTQDKNARLKICTS